jgi:hypothetical protein
MDISWITLESTHNNREGSRVFDGWEVIWNMSAKKYYKEKGGI